MGVSMGENMRQVAWWTGFLFLILLFVTGTLASAFAAINADVSVEQRSNFGRIVIRFDEILEHTHELDGSILQIKFQQPVDADVSGIAEAMSAYVSVARRDPDGMAIRLALQSNFRVNIMAAGNYLFVDILPKRWQGEPPPLPQEVLRELSQKATAAAKAAKQEARQRQASNAFRLQLKVAEHPTFSRMVFAWNKPVDVELTRSGSKAELKFSAKADVDLSRLKSDPPKFLRKAELHNDRKKGGMSISLVIDPRADVRGFREGNNYVLDLFSGKDSEDIARGSEKVTLAGQWQTETVNEDGNVGTDGVRQEKTAFEKVLEQGGFAIPELVELPAQKKRPSPIAKKPADAGAQQSQLSVAEPEKPTREVIVSAQNAKHGGLRIEFPFSEPIAAAMFRRSDILWLVFDSIADIEDSQLREKLARITTDIEHVRGDGMQYYRLHFSSPQLASARQDKTGSWVIDIGDMVAEGARALVLERSKHPRHGNIITVAYEDPGHVHWLHDEATGENIGVVTSYGPLRRITSLRNFVEFQALPSIHGFAMRPKSDDIAMRVRLDEIMLSSRNGLYVTDGNLEVVLSQRRIKRPMRKASNSAGFTSFKSVTPVQDDVLLDHVSAKERRIAMEKNPVVKNSLRLDLARFMLVNRFASEALGVLGQIKNSSPTVSNSHEFKAMRTVANVMLARPQDVMKSLDNQDISDNRDAMLWRGIMETQKQRWPEAIKYLGDGIAAISSYQPEFQDMFRMALIRAALETSQLEKAADTLKLLGASALKKHRPEATLLKARYLAAIGQDSEAKLAYERAMATGKRPIVAEAELYNTMLRLRTGEIKPAAAIKALEGLSVIWRGDNVEMNTLRELARLHATTKNYRRAFQLLDVALKAYPEADKVARLHNDMRKQFVDIYLHKKNDDIPPVGALSLFYDFKHLTPVGRLGDELIRNLSDRLIKVDLLDQATQLLDYQIKNRLKGAAKAQVAVRLAMVHLMNHKPELALRSIQTTRMSNLPGKILRSRKILEARALGEMSRPESAIAVLSSLEGDDVEQLRAEVLWQGRRWQQAGEQFELLLGSRWRDGDELNEDERFNIMRAAIAYALAGDQFGLDRLGKKYFNKMKKTPDVEAFALVTRPVEARGKSFKKLARDIATIDTLDKFMQDFRKRYDSPGSV
jgi:hypothetical protein